MGNSNHSVVNEILTKKKQTKNLTTLHNRMYIPIYKSTEVFYVKNRIGYMLQSTIFVEYSLENCIIPNGKCLNNTEPSNLGIKYV